MFNREYNAKNPYQGTTKKVLCICSAGLLRSPTAAVVLSQPPYNFNTRAVGLEASHALIPLESVHLTWADEIVVMENRMLTELEDRFHDDVVDKDITVLNIPDRFSYRDPELMRLIAERYDSATEDAA